MSFEKALQIVLDLEGRDRITDDPSDPGGLTKWGISQRAFPSTDVRALTFDQAADLYRVFYWNRCRCDDLPNGVDLAVFDFAVNAGTATACKALQRAVNVSADGVLGPQTMAAVKSADKATIIERIGQQRVAHYLRINKTMYLHGWLNRVITITVRALTC